MLNLQTALYSINILTTLSLPIHDQEMFFHLFNFFQQYLLYKSFAALVKFIPIYFILFDAIINRIVFLISFSDSFLLVYRNVSDFCILILYPEVLLNFFIRSNSVLVESYGFLYKISCLLQIETIKILLSNLDAFYFFFLPNYPGQGFKYYVE